MDDFYTVNQAAIALKVHPLTIRRYIRNGQLAAYRAGGNIRITVSDLGAFTENFSPHQVNRNKFRQPATKKPFSINDPLFRLKARGLNVSNLERNNNP